MSPTVLALTVLVEVGIYCLVRRDHARPYEDSEPPRGELLREVEEPRAEPWWASALIFGVVVGIGALLFMAFATLVHRP